LDDNYHLGIGCPSRAGDNYHHVFDVFDCSSRYQGGSGYLVSGGESRDLGDNYHVVFDSLRWNLGNKYRGFGSLSCAMGANCRRVDSGSRDLGDSYQLEGL
jgi:hypothetical protein